MDAASKSRLSRSTSSTAFRKRNSTLLGLHKLILERVIGLTACTNAQLAVDQVSGTIAYTAGCVVVLMGKGKQENIINPAKKAVSTVAFSPDGKYLAIGESGHQPAVRVFEVSSKLQISEFSGHKFGVTCVAFSPSSKYLVSIGTQHDMVTNVWNWRASLIVASNKISSKVNALAFSSDGNMFVTVGVRHLKYWFLDESKRKTTIQNRNETVPLLGRSGLLGEHKNNVFVDVVCGKGSMAETTYVITQAGLLCQLIDRQICKTVELKTIRAYCLQASERHLFVGCASGVIRVFDAETLHFIATLPKPHPLGVDVVSGAIAVAWQNEFRYPDALGLAYRESTMTLTSVYSDRSLYVWDLTRLPSVARVNAFLYHSSCVWSIDMIPALNRGSYPLPMGTFVTSGTDDTIRMWSMDPTSYSSVHKKKPIYNSELLGIVYTDPSLGSLCEQEYNSDKPDIYESRNGVRCLAISPDGLHLASGDLVGNVRVHELCALRQLHTIEAHDAGVLCLQYSDLSSGEKYLVSASRDRLIHIFDAKNDYTHLQTLSDHSSSIVAIRLLETPDATLMISCSYDKSLLFRVAQYEPEFSFVLKHNLISKTTPHDMIVTPQKNILATACQDRFIRLYNLETGKQKRNYKGSNSEDGYLLKLTIDDTGTFLAASCSDKSIAIIDFLTGEIITTVSGHSELITGLKFSRDCLHLISVAADGCVFMWRLDTRLTERMLEKSILTSQPVHVSTPTAPSSVEDSDEKTFVVNDRKSVNTAEVAVTDLPSWAQRITDPQAANGRSRWTKEAAKTIVPLAVQSSVSVLEDNDDMADATDDDDELFFHEPQDLHTSRVQRADSQELPSAGKVYYQPAEGDGEFNVVEKSVRLEDEKSSTSEAASFNTMESEDDSNTTASTPASSVPSTPLSPNGQLMHMLQQVPSAVTPKNSPINRKESLQKKLGSMPDRVPAPGVQNPAAAKPSANPNSLTVQFGRNKNSPYSSTESLASMSSHGDEQSANGKQLQNIVEHRSVPSAHSNYSSASVNGVRDALASAPSHDRGSALMLAAQNIRVDASQLNGLMNGVHSERTEQPAHSATNSVASVRPSTLPTSGRTFVHHRGRFADQSAGMELASSEAASSQGETTFQDIDAACNSLRDAVLVVESLYLNVKANSSDRDYLIESIRDVSDSLIKLLPPATNLEPLLHQYSEALLSEVTRKLNSLRPADAR